MLTKYKLNIKIFTATIVVNPPGYIFNVTPVSNVQRASYQMQIYGILYFYMFGFNFLVLM